MMGYNLTEAETQLADLIWENEPIESGDLVKLCESKFVWKKSTTYTMLKRLEQKEVFRNTESVVTSLLKKEEFYAEKSKQVVDKVFNGSLPRFIAAFTKSNKLSAEEINQLQKLIDEHREV